MLVSYGHGKDSVEKTVGTLQFAGVTSIVDIRSSPTSSKNPQFYGEEMERWLPSSIQYRWDVRLGGHRNATLGNPNTALRVRGFKNYAAYMWTEEFLAGIEDLIAESDSGVVAFMCAESLWWRCHRRMVSDFLVAARNIPVMHLMHNHKLVPHDPFSPKSDTGIRLMDNGLLIYDGGQQLLAA